MAAGRVQLTPVIADRACGEATHGRAISARWAALFYVALLALAGGAAPSPELRLAQAQAEAEQLARQRVASLERLRQLEQATDQAANDTAALATRRGAAEVRLQAAAAQLAPMLPITLRLSLYPAETLLAAPSPPQQSLTGLLVLHSMARQLEAEAEAVRAEQVQLAALTTALQRQEACLATAQAAQAAQAAGLDRAIAEAQARGRDAEDAATATARRAAEQAASAQSLRGALSQIEAVRREDEARARADAAQAERQRQDAAAAEAHRRQAALAAPAGPGLNDPSVAERSAPVLGAVVHSFGDVGDGGPSTGVSYAAPPAAHVSAPCGGRVVFAGPFRSFGKLVIIDCGGGYHFVLAGLDRLDAVVGRPVQPGEPIGVMPAWDPHAGGPRPLLYVELRDHGQPMNPAPFLHVRS